MRMKPKTFKPEELEAVRVEAATQSIGNVVQKSSDPEHFPVFEIPVNAKVLIYVPNHTVVDQNTMLEDLRMDRPLLHSVSEGKRFYRIRCIHGLSEASGYSGNCPLCEGESEPWDLANAQIKEQCKIRGLNPTDADDEAVKSVKREQYSKRVIKAPERYYTFPIVVIETDPNDIKKIIFEDDGATPKHKIYWYTISQSAYEKKWLKALEGMEDEPNHPGGESFILNYTYESKSGEYNKRDSARELQVIPKKLKGFSEFAKMYDAETEEWTPEKAFTTVIENAFYEEADLEEEVNRLLAGTREKLAIFNSVASMPALGEGSGASPVFNLSKPVPADDGIGGLPMNDGIDA